MGALSGRKALRLNRIQQLLVQRSSGYTAAELAEVCGVHARTILRDLLDLQGDPFYVPLLRGPGHRWSIAPDGRFALSPLNLSLQEGAALYLAARLLDRVCDEPNLYVTQALEALAGVLPERVGTPIFRLTEAASRSHGDSTFSQVFGCIALGWGLGRKIALTYHSLSSNRVSECLFSPYDLEPSPSGRGVYAIGWAEPPDEMRTYKLERVIEATLTAEAFEPPQDFDPKGHLARAWGVWTGSEGPVEVRLRFRPEVTRRVRETQWHISQEIRDLEGGGCELTAEVLEPLEMLPWIRSWGPACEVLAPQSLRSRVMEEVREMVARYDNTLYD